MVSLSTDTSSDDGLKHPSLHDKIKIVSQQSTARPGCVIQLDAISDATHVSSHSPCNGLTFVIPLCARTRAPVNNCITGLSLFIFRPSTVEPSFKSSTGPSH
jgi:hypothetical protein